MKLLLDTQILIWASAAPLRIPLAGRVLLEDGQNDLYFSAASIWEIAIKRSLGRAGFDVETRVLRRGLLDNGYAEIPVTSNHSVLLENLPAIHKDPFDRILVAQAMAEGMVLITTDEMISKYPGAIRRVS